MINKLSLTTLTSPIEEELARSPGQVKKYDPLQDPQMEWPEPQETESTQIKTKEDIGQRVDRAMKHRELAEFSQRPGQELIPEEKQKYEQLWETANLQSAKKLTRIANYLETKYYQ